MQIKAKDVIKDQGNQYAWLDITCNIRIKSHLETKRIRKKIRISFRKDCTYCLKLLDPLWRASNEG